VGVRQEEVRFLYVEDFLSRVILFANQ